jgi:hypothetical protein
MGGWSCYGCFSFMAIAVVSAWPFYWLDMTDCSTWLGMFGCWAVGLLGWT